MLTPYCHSFLAIRVNYFILKYVFLLFTFTVFHICLELNFSSYIMNVYPLNKHKSLHHTLIHYLFYTTYYPVTYYTQYKTTVPYRHNMSKNLSHLIDPVIKIYSVFCAFEKSLNLYYNFLSFVTLGDLLNKLTIQKI